MSPSPNPKSNRTRKISIVHHDYAFCIIEPLKAETIPRVCSSPTTEDTRLHKEFLSQLQQSLKDREIKSRAPVRNLSDGQLVYPSSFGFGQSTTTETLQHISDLQALQLTRSETERENFRRWSFSHYQHIYHPNTPNGQNTEFLSKELQLRRAAAGLGLGVPMTTLPRENKSRKCNHNDINFNSKDCTCSSTSKIFSSILSIPDMIRKLSSDKTPKFDAKTADFDTKEQMKNMYVY